MVSTLSALLPTLQLKMIIIGVDIAVNALWAFMWFVNFSYTTDQRRRGFISTDGAIRNCANAGIAFSFFSIILWVSFVVLKLWCTFFFVPWLQNKRPYYGHGCKCRVDVNN